MNNKMTNKHGLLVAILVVVSCILAFFIYHSCWSPAAIIAREQYAKQVKIKEEAKAREAAEVALLEKRAEEFALLQQQKEKQAQAAAEFAREAAEFAALEKQTQMRADAEKRKKYEEFASVKTSQINRTEGSWYIVIYDYATVAGSFEAYWALIQNGIASYPIFICDGFCGLEVTRSFESESEAEKTVDLIRTISYLRYISPKIRQVSISTTMPIDTSLIN
ncbi:MAG: hypothetical protein WC390_10250 [Sulfurimonas sp.]|jgi:hypothetical protein